MLLKNRVFILLLFIILFASLQKPVTLLLMEKSTDISDISLRFSDLNKAKQGFKVGEEIKLIIENKGNRNGDIDLYYGENKNFNPKNSKKITIKAKSSEIFTTKIIKSGRVYFYTRGIYISSKVVK